MPERSIEVPGVPRLPVTEDLFREQPELLHGTPPREQHPGPAEQEVREQPESVVLIGVLVFGPGGRFDIGDFYRCRDDLPRDRWQVADDERYLTLDGSALAVPHYDEPSGPGDRKIAFHLYYWDPTKPLQSS
ncbi:MAG: hypothetical protein HRF45_06510 [Fimbriimonadia bacterium]|jgi:hypothetical protein